MKKILGHVPPPPHSFSLTSGVLYKESLHCIAFHRCKPTASSSRRFQRATSACLCRCRARQRLLVSSPLARSAVRDKRPQESFCPLHYQAGHWPRCPPGLSFLLCRTLERMQAPTCHPRKFPSLVCTLGLEGHCFLCDVFLGSCFQA